MTRVFLDWIWNVFYKQLTCDSKNYQNVSYCASFAYTTPTVPSAGHSLEVCSQHPPRHQWGPLAIENHNCNQGLRNPWQLRLQMESTTGNLQKWTSLTRDFTSYHKEYTVQRSSTQPEQPTMSKLTQDWYSLNKQHVAKLQEANVQVWWFAGEGISAFEGGALALAKTTDSAFGPLLLETGQNHISQGLHKATRQPRKTSPFGLRTWSYNVQARSPYYPFQQRAANPTTIPSNSIEVSNLNDHLDPLKQKIRILQDTDGGEKVFCFGGLGFSTIEDSLTWLDKNLEAIKFGYFIDVYNFCILAAREFNGERDYFKRCRLPRSSDSAVPKKQQRYAISNPLSLISSRMEENECMERINRYFPTFQNQRTGRQVLWWIW